MNLLTIDPSDFDLPEYLLEVSVAPSDLHPHYAEVDPQKFNQQFYQDDRHITGAALPLHPLLGTEAEAAVYGFLPWPESVRDLPAGTRLTELGDDGDPAIHLLLQGRARLVATRDVGGEARRWVVAQYRTGQWIGFPRLLREFDVTERRWTGWPEGRVRLEAETLGPVRTQRIALDDALSLVHDYADFRRFVEHHVAVRLARRREMLARIGENPLLRLLSPADREYLLQLGAIVSIGDAVAEPYLPAGPPAGRAALLLRGEATLLLPTGEAGMRYGATLRPGDLVGHEGLLMDAERRDPDATAVEIVEPPRTTEVRLVPGTQVLQFYWYALRWVLDNRAPVWNRVKRILSGDPSGVTDPMPTIVSFHAARPGLGTSVLACGTGAELATSGERTVEVIDLQGAENFAARWKPCGFTTEDRAVPLQSGPRMLRAEGRPTEIACRVLVPPAAVRWPSRVEVLWPIDPQPGRVEDLVDALEMDAGVSHIVVAGCDPKGHDLVSQVLDRLHGRCAAVFYVCDDSGTAYPNADPEHLTWVYRMTPEYRAAEAHHAKRVRFDWLFAGAINAAPDPARRAIEGILGYSPSAELERESVQGPRRVVRVPDDPSAAATYDRGGLGEIVGPGAQPGALTRAFARLARVVEGRTVGLALGGGGAWGFSHVALLRNLEAQGVPIDYIAGTSFGSVVGGLYVVGGMRALELLVDANSATGRGIGPTLRALAGGALNRALFVAPFSSVAVETFVHDQLRAVGARSAGDPPCLGATEIPFYPVGTNLGTHEPLALPHATAGMGVRMSGSLPPIFAALLRRYDRIADGAFVANVPSRVVREVGAHFVIAANVVPPPPAPVPANLGRSLVTWLPRKIVERLEDTLRGVFVLAWKAGEDQGALAADYPLDMRPTAANLFEMWRGRDIVDEIEKKHFEGKNARRIRDAWDHFRGNRVRSARRWSPTERSL
jgi:predicted acylesterase/phospholipase RssA/CRP-like cAMP-binding protein